MLVTSNAGDLITSVECKIYYKMEEHLKKTTNQNLEVEHFPVLQRCIARIEVVAEFYQKWNFKGGNRGSCLGKIIRRI